MTCKRDVNKHEVETELLQFKATLRKARRRKVKERRDGCVGVLRPPSWRAGAGTCRPTTGPDQPNASPLPLAPPAGTRAAAARPLEVRSLAAYHLGDRPLCLADELRRSACPAGAAGARMTWDFAATSCCFYRLLSIKENRFLIRPNARS